MNDAIAAPIQQLLALFASQFSNVKFADIDVRVLDEAAAKVTAQADAVARAQAALDAARAQLSADEEALSVKAQRALAYARIYAEEDGELATRLDAIVLARTPRTLRTARDAAEAKPGGEVAPARRRGRPSRESASVSTLFQPPASGESMSNTAA